MKAFKLLTLFLALAIIFTNCMQSESTDSISSNPTERDLGQAAVVNNSDANILDIAVGSKDHTTLVAAVQAAQIENVLVNAGPLTVFAPTNEAFAALPEGTVESLLKPENKSTLTDILYYHSAPGSYKGSLLTDGRQIYMANGDNVEIKILENGDVTVNGANIIATIEATNGVVHVIDAVLLPPE